MRTKGCPLCKKAVHSDITSSGSCQLCGMPLERSQTILWKHEEEAFKFCSTQCMRQFKQEVFA